MVTGWLDFVNDDSKYALHNAKIQESSHQFVCDYLRLDGVAYDIMLIDDPMNMHLHLEIYQRFTGGQNG